MPPLRATSPRGQQPPGNLPSHGSTSGPSTRQGTPPSSTQSRLGRGVATTGAVWGRRVSRVPTAAARWVCRPWQAGRPPQPRAPDTRKGEHRGESLAELGAPRGPCCPTAGSVAPPPTHTPPPGPGPPPLLHSPHRAQTYSQTVSPVPAGNRSTSRARALERGGRSDRTAPRGQARFCEKADPAACAIRGSAGPKGRLAPTAPLTGRPGAGSGPSRVWLQTPVAGAPHSLLRTGDPGNT